MNKTFRGDTFWRTYEVEYENEPYIFEIDDVVRVAFCDEHNKYLLKEHKVTSPEESIRIEWTPEEMAELESKTYILEVEVTTKKFRKTYQEFVDISKDYIITQGAE